MGNPMKIRAKAEGDVVEVKVLMSHIMETGQRKNPAGEPIPAHFIQTVTVSCNDRTVLSAQWGPAVSANPFLSFKFKGGQKGDKIKISWLDNKGDSRSDESTIG
jgi:sulfur-oxidizing protein SoxZ